MPNLFYAVADPSAAIAQHAKDPWVHPWLRDPLLRYQLRKTEVYTLAVGEDYSFKICFDGNHIWVALNTAPGKVVKMNPADGSYVTYTLAAGEDYPFGICFDGTHIWVCTHTSPGKIRRITKVGGSV